MAIIYPGSDLFSVVTESSRKKHLRHTVIVLWFLLLGSQLKTQTVTPLKVVELDFPNSQMVWNGKMDRVPCLEPFSLKIQNIENSLPANITPTTVITATVIVYETTGGVKGNRPIVLGGVRRTYTVTGKGSVLNSLVVQPLLFKRYYFIEVTLQGGAVSTMSVNATAYNKDLVYYELFATAGGVVFFGEDKGTGYNFSIVTGLKFNLRATSINGKYGKFELYRRASHVSMVVGAVINPLTYQSTTVKPLAVLIKPAIGINVDVNKIFGFTVGTVIGNQEYQSNLNGLPHPVWGLWFGVSVSAEVFQAFRKSVPSMNLPEGFAPTTAQLN